MNRRRRTMRKNKKTKTKKRKTQVYKDLNEQHFRLMPNRNKLASQGNERKCR